MFLVNQTKESIKCYADYLSIVGSLSELFSDSEIPYLYYRVAEKIFCKSFSATDLSRSDVSFDAKKDLFGIGLKTFLAGNNKTYQKVAEFNNDRPFYTSLPPHKLIHRIAELRNKRINFTEQAYGIEHSIYHCVVRDKGVFKLFEEPMNKIQITSIQNIKSKNNSITFNDGLHDYSFQLSKSTLLKRFLTNDITYSFDVKILNNPIEQLQKILQQTEITYKKRILQTIYLPLYGRNHRVFSKSGLNQWNAGGRSRNENEIYIPIPIIIHKLFPDFFPDRNISFDLKLPTGEIMKTKVCQENNKALMSYSNRELGQWILRKVLKLQEGEILTYEKLQEIGIDSVRIDKMSDTKYDINFSKVQSYELFIESNQPE